MITKDNFKNLLLRIGFKENKEGVLIKKFKETNAFLKADFNKEKLIYPENERGGGNR